MTKSNYTDRFFEATARIDKLIWIPAAIGGGCISDDLKEMVEDLYDGNEQIIARLPQMKGVLCGEEAPDREYVAETLAYVDGFFAQMARPVPQMLGTRQSYSWGYFQTGWVYAETLDELATLTEEFSKRVIEDARSSAA